MHLFELLVLPFFKNSFQHSQVWTGLTCDTFSKWVTSSSGDSGCVGWLGKGYTDIGLVHRAPWIKAADILVDDSKLLALGNEGELEQKG